MAAGFPTTVNPILQNGLVPVFVDVELGTYNTTRGAGGRGDRPADPGDHAGPHAGQSLPGAGDRRAGRAQHDLFLIEDNCDALGSHLRRSS